MILKNSLNLISEFFNYSSNQIRKIYLSSRIYNKKISRELINSELVILTNVKHSILLEKPDETANNILKFLLNL